MRVINREISISGEWLRVGAEATGLPLPGVLTSESVWRDPAEQRAHVNQALDHQDERHAETRGRLSARNTPAPRPARSR